MPRIDSESLKLCCEPVFRIVRIIFLSKITKEEYVVCWNIKCSTYFHVKSRKRTVFSHLNSFKVYFFFHFVLHDSNSYFRVFNFMLYIFFPNEIPVIQMIKCLKSNCNSYKLIQEIWEVFFSSFWCLWMLSFVKSILVHNIVPWFKLQISNE